MPLMDWWGIPCSSTGMKSGCLADSNVGSWQAWREKLMASSSFLSCGLVAPRALEVGLLVFFGGGLWHLLLGGPWCLLAGGPGGPSHPSSASGFPAAAQLHVWSFLGLASTNFSKGLFLHVLVTGLGSHLSSPWQSSHVEITNSLLPIKASFHCKLTLIGSRDFDPWSFGSQLFIRRPPKHEKRLHIFMYVFTPS